jgi:hypothetical protein
LVWRSSGRVVVGPPDRSPGTGRRCNGQARVQTGAPDSGQQSYLGMRFESIDHTLGTDEVPIEKRVTWHRRSWHACAKRAASIHNEPAVTLVDDTGIEPVT